MAEPPVAKNETVASNEPIDVRALDEMMESLFMRYDMDHSGTINTVEELRMLTCNLCFKFKIPSTDMMNKIASMNACVETGSGWPLERYRLWFCEEFVYGQELKDIPPAWIRLPHSSPSAEQPVQHAVQVIQGSVRRWCVRVKAKQADRFIATQLNLLNQAFQLAATAKTTNTWKGIQVALEEILKHRNVAAASRKLIEDDWVCHENLGSGIVKEVLEDTKLTAMVRFDSGVVIPALGINGLTGSSVDVKMFPIRAKDFWDHLYRHIKTTLMACQHNTLDTDRPEDADYADEHDLRPDGGAQMYSQVDDEWYGSLNNIIIFAIEYEHTNRIAVALIEAMGGHLQLTVNKDGLTPLHVAMRFNKQKVIAAIISSLSSTCCPEIPKRLICREVELIPKVTGATNKADFSTYRLAELGEEPGDGEMLARDTETREALRNRLEELQQSLLFERAIQSEKVIEGMQQDIVKLHDAVSRLGCNEDLPEDYIVTFSHDRLGELAQVYPEQFMELMESRALVLANRSIVCRTWAENTRQDQSTPPNLRCRMKPTAIMIKGSSKEDPVDLWTRPRNGAPACSSDVRDDPDGIDVDVTPCIIAFPGIAGRSVGGDLRRSLLHKLGRIDNSNLVNNLPVKAVIQFKWDTYGWWKFLLETSYFLALVIPMIFVNFNLSGVTMP